MPALEVTLKKAKSDPEIEVIIGQAQQGTYRIFTWDKNGSNPKSVAQGVNWDDIADIHKLGKKKDLDGAYVTWEILVTSPAGGSGQLYAVTVVIRQDGELCEGGLFQESGELNGTTAVFGSRRITVA